jgi:hypothetical protein
MKKTILILIAGALAVGCANVRHGQTTEQAGVEIRNVGSDAPLTGPDAAVAKSARNFLRMYGDLQNEKWYSLPGGSLAKFEGEGIGYRVVFDKKGNWVYTLKQYTEKELPVRVRAMVKSVYYYYPIAWVKEFNQSQSVVYLIHIENDREWKTIRVADGEMEVAEEFSKGRLDQNPG